MLIINVVDNNRYLLCISIQLLLSMQRRVIGIINRTQLYFIKTNMKNKLKFKIVFPSFEFKRKLLIPVINIRFLE